MEIGRTMELQSYAAIVTFGQSRRWELVVAASLIAKQLTSVVRISHVSKERIQLVVELSLTIKQLTYVARAPL